MGKAGGRCKEESEGAASIPREIGEVGGSQLPGSQVALGAMGGLRKPRAIQRRPITSIGPKIHW